MRQQVVLQNKQTMALRRMKLLLLQELPQNLRKRVVLATMSLPQAKLKRVEEPWPQTLAFQPPVVGQTQGPPQTLRKEQQQQQGRWQ
jgi:hypothetical protein